MIRYTLPEAGHVRLEVFDVTGRKVSRLIDGHHQAGRHSVRFNGSHLASGIYIYRLSVGEFVQQRQMTLIR